MLAADKAKVIDLPPILRARIDLYNSRSTRSTRDHRPMLGDYAWSCGSWSLYSATGNIPMALSEAIIATYMTIHMARSPGSHSGRIASPCQEFREGAEILRVWLSGNESTRSLCPTSLSCDAGVALARARTPPQRLAPYSEVA